MYCDASDHCVVTARPDVHCAFDVMDKCSAFADDNARQACIDGVRDAHLLTRPMHAYTNDEKQAYDAGNFTCFQDCLPLYVSQVMVPQTIVSTVPTGLQVSTNVSTSTK